MTPQLTAPLTCVLPSQQDGPLRTQRERDWSETGGCVSFPSVTTQDSTTQHSALLSLLPALGQGSNDSSEGQLWPPKLALLTAAPQGGPHPAANPKHDQQPVPAAGVGVPLVSPPGQKRSGLIQGRGPSPLPEAQASTASRDRASCPRRHRKYPRERALSTGTGPPLVTPSCSHEKGTFFLPAEPRWGLQAPLETV